MQSEKIKNEDIEKVIADYYDIPVEYMNDTRYYYNYTDLNMDGTNEIFALVIGLTPVERVEIQLLLLKAVMRA